MCRWFAYISPTEECLLEDVLITPNHSICKQINSSYLPGLVPNHSDIGKDDLLIAAHNKFLNIDGFGVGYYTDSRSEFTPEEGPRPILFKSAQPALRDPNFRALCENTATKTLFAHIRSATSTPVVSVNNHPFTFGRHMIMHNGLIGDFERFAHEICGHMHPDAFKAMAGRTDSEHFAALYMTFLDAEGKGTSAWNRKFTPDEMKTALKRSLDTIFNIQQNYQTTGQGGKDYRYPPSSMNVAVTDGKCMVAMRVHNHATVQPPTLYHSTTAGISLNRKFPGSADSDENPAWSPKANWTKNEADHGKHNIIASEPSTKDLGAWDLIARNSCVMIASDGSLRKEDMEPNFHSVVDIAFNPDEKTIGHLNADGNWISV